MRKIDKESSGSIFHSFAPRVLSTSHFAQGVLSMKSPRFLGLQILGTFLMFPVYLQKRRGDSPLIILFFFMPRHCGAVLLCKNQNGDPAISVRRFLSALKFGGGIWISGNEQSLKMFSKGLSKINTQSPHCCVPCGERSQETFCKYCFFKKIHFLYFLGMGVLSVCISGHHVHFQCLQSLKRALDSLKPELQKVMRHHMDTRTQTQVLWKSSKCW